MKKIQHITKALMLAATALAFTAATFAQEQAETLEEVVVKGIRRSLEAASEMKRGDSRIVDAVVAEDIGKLPDNNIAEALQRITGVALNRDFGIGESVSIRGLSQNRVELNGRTTTGTDRDGISLEDYPSSFLQSISVIKSPTADMIEGALGGTLALETVRPLDLSERRLFASFDGEYADKAEEWAPILNASAGDNWDMGDGGSFGALVSVSYQDRTIRQDEFKNRVRLYDEDVNGLTANTPSGRFAVREQNTLEQYVEERERLSANLSLQWAPESARGSVYVDLAYTDRSGGQFGNSTLDVGGSRTYDTNTTQDAYGQVNNYQLTGAFVIPKTWSDFRSTETFSNAAGFEWDLTDNISISAEASFATSDTLEPQSEFNLRPVSRPNHQAWVAQLTPGVRGNYDADRSAFGLRHTIDATMSQTGDQIPSIVYSDPQALLAAENLAFRALRYDRDVIKNDEEAYRFDIDFAEPAGMDWISSFKAGFRYTSNDYTFDRLRYRTSDNRYKDTFDNVTGLPVTYWLDDMEALAPGSFVTINHPNTFNQHGLSGQFDIGEYRIYDPQLLSSDPQAAFELVQQMMAGTNNAETGDLESNLVSQEGSFRDIAEETTAFYASAEMDFGRLRGVIGGRYVETDIESRAFDADGALVTDTHSYNDFLPSINLSYDLSDNTVVRAAAGKVLRRADYEDLSPALVIGGGISTAEQGAFDLAPYRATQYDLSFEHYFGEGNLVSVAVFYKDVKSFLSESVSCEANSQTSMQQVTEWENICLLNSAGVSNPDLVFSTLEDFAGAPDPDTAGVMFTQMQRDAGLTGLRTNRQVNGEEGVVQGIELGYQQAFTFLPGAWSGLGVNANYTYADSEQPNGNTLLDISKHTVNLQGYWEYGDFQIRLAYNFRTAFLDTEEETRVNNVGALARNSATNDATDPNFDPTAGNNYKDDRGQLDFSASWHFNDNITFVASATNLTNEPTLLITELGSPWKYDEADRRFSLGVRANY